MTTNVFIVGSTTFKVHLENLFAGTGAKDMIVDFNNSGTSRLAPTTEQMLVDMIADVSRVREGDQLIFYLQQNFQEGIREGKFYRVFKIKKVDNLLAFYDPNDKIQYLKNELDKSLTFRVIIEPCQIYPLGVTEWEALDDIKNIISPHQMLWSLIYRKLKGNRGCTPITIYESQRLCNLIWTKNNRNTLEINERQLTFDKDSEEIKLLDSRCLEYRGRKTDLNVLPRLIKKYKENKQFEHHLEALISKNLGAGTINSLDQNLLENKELVWLGNQVSCGVGMQRIDMVLWSFKWVTILYNSSLVIKMALAKPVNMWKNINFSMFSHIFTGTTATNLPKWVKIHAHFKSRLTEVTHSELQRGIDILFSLKEGEQYFHCPVELKSTFASEDNIRQLRRYMDWMNQYFVPNFPGDLCPILITRKMPDRQIGRKKEFKFDPKGKSEYFSELVGKINQFNQDYKCKLKFTEYLIDQDDNIVFQGVEY